VADLPQLAAEELRRRDAMGSLLAYRAYMAAVTKDFVFSPARHHQLIIAHLQDLEAGRIQRLLICAPPASAKSTYCSVQFVTWHLARNPTHTILCASNTQDLAERFNRRRLNAILHPAWTVLNDVRLSAREQAVSNFATQAGGGCIAAGVGTTITGIRSDLNVLDDPVKGFEEANSATQLEKIADWYFADFRSRLSKEGKELIVTTRWAKKDIAGRVIDLARECKEDWTILRLPMVSDSGDDPLQRAIGDPLWAEGYSSQKVDEERRDVRRWSCMWQQMPLDEAGSWVGNEHIAYEDEPPAPLSHVVAVDLALTVGRGDYTAIVVGGLDADRRLHIVRVERARTTPEETVRKLFELCQIYEPTELLIDDDNASKVFTRLMFEIARTRGHTPPPLSPQPLRGRDKETRAAAVRGLFLGDGVRIVRGPWNHALHRELMDFPASDHDDQIDALSLIGRRYPLLSSPAAPIVAQRDPYAGMLVRPGADGRVYLNATLDELFEDRERMYRRSH
jgi:predicted phage terminase large subunit-like protein